MVATEEIVKEILSRGLDGFKPVFYVDEKKRTVIVKPAGPGLLVNPNPIVFVIEDVNKVDEEFLRKIEELTKLDTMIKLVKSLYDFPEWILERYIYIGGGYTEGNGIACFLGGYNIQDEQETKAFNEKILQNIGKTFDTDLIWLELESPYSPEKFNNGQGLVVKTQALVKSGKIDELLEEQKEELKNLAFQYPEEFAAVKKAVA